MTAVAGFNGLVTCATGASATYVAMQGIKSFKLTRNRDLMDVTDFSDGSVRARLAGLMDVSVELSGDYEVADAGFLRAQAAFAAGEDVALQLWSNTGTGSVGYAALFQIASIDLDDSVDGKAEISLSCQVNATLLGTNGIMP